MELGFKLKVDEKGEFDSAVYAEMAKFCMEHNCKILDNRPDCFEIAARTQEEMDEQKTGEVRSIRSEYMAIILNKVERYDTQKAAGIETTDSAETYKNYLLYLQYLRDIPQSADFPNIEVLTFEKWVEGLK